MAYVDCVHSGGDVGIGDEAVHTNVLFDISSSTLFRVFPLMLICQFLTAFWHLVASGL